MKWEIDGYTIIRKAYGTKDYYYSIVIDGEEVEKYYPPHELNSSSFQEYIDLEGTLIGSTDNSGRRLWLPEYIIRKIDAHDDWADYEDLFSSYSKREAESKFSKLSATEGFELRLICLEKPHDFDDENEVDYDLYIPIEIKSLNQ